MIFICYEAPIESALLQPVSYYDMNFQLFIIASLHMSRSPLSEMIFDILDDMYSPSKV